MTSQPKPRPIGFNEIVIAGSIAFTCQSFITADPKRNHHAITNTTQAADALP
jgi:hypothetical protein